MQTALTHNACADAWREAHAARCGGAESLARALVAARARTLMLAQAYESHLGPALRVPQQPDLNLPLWELGHVGWFQDWWVARNPQRHLGIHADPDHARLAARVANADDCYDSSRVAHARRWSLSLPDSRATRAELAASLEETLQLLARTNHDDQSLHFFRLVLLHEDMHAEAAAYMAQALDIPLPIDAPLRSPGAATGSQRRFSAGPWTLGYGDSGFAFDNELRAHAVELDGTEIDATPVCWAQYLAFVEAGGYRQRQCWSADGWAWRKSRLPGDGPRYLRRDPKGGWEQQSFGHWHASDPQADAIHLSWFEADAWCRWAGRRLPDEAEWERAAVTDPAFHWGTVWEWTASSFVAYPGFEAHPYRDYSMPWFGSRKVLRGGCWATSARIARPAYRNFFSPDRSDVFAGFRTCAL